MTYSMGMALFLFLCVGVYVVWCAVTSGPSRKWIRRMQRIQDGRARQQAEWINSNVFPSWRDHK